MSEKEREAELSRERGRRYRERHRERVREMARIRRSLYVKKNPDAVKATRKRRLDELRSRPEVEVLLESEQRFWPRVEKLSTDECWEWKGPRYKSGYGMFTVGPGYVRTASRVAYILENGPLDEGKIACHRCDNPPCCNPSHLYAGTHADNSRDKIERGRAVPRRSLLLTPDQVASIRASSKTQREIATEFGISRPYVSRIRSGQSCRPPSSATT